MTKFAVITDAHANLPALEAALAAIGDLGCEAIYHTGDAVGIGPFRNEVLDRLLHTPGMHFVMGNHDELCALGLPDPPPDWLHDEYVANMRWTQEHVNPELQRMMVAWPYEIVETMSSRLFSFLHYPRDPEGSGFVPIIADPSVAELDALFGQQQADVIFYGHHHPAADHYGRARYINAGSLGCSREELAHYTVVDVSQSRSLNFEHHAVDYDGSALLEAMELRDVPDHELICKMFFPRASPVF